VTDSPGFFRRIGEGLLVNALWALLLPILAVIATALAIRERRSGSPSVPMSSAKNQPELTPRPSVPPVTFERSAPPTPINVVPALQSPRFGGVILEISASQTPFLRQVALPPCPNSDPMPMFRTPYGPFHQIWISRRVAGAAESQVIAHSEEPHPAYVRRNPEPPAENLLRFGAGDFRIEVHCHATCYGNSDNRDPIGSSRAVWTASRASNWLEGKPGTRYRAVARLERADDTGCMLNVEEEALER
jgi:hypothetical protein